MATTIRSTIERIVDALNSHFDANGYEWKTEESQSEHQQRKPVVYPYVCAKRNEANFPEICPSITVELTEVNTPTRDQLSLAIVCHCVVVNSSIIQREKTVMLDDGIHYAFLDEDGYTDEGVVEALFSDCMLLGEETMNALRSMAGVRDIRLIPASVLDDFPYCQCQVTATILMLSQFIPDDLL